jgi:hypothetical protein
MLGHFNKRSQFDRPLRKNAAIDEELAEFDARMLRPQRNIVAKRRHKVRSRARAASAEKQTPSVFQHARLAPIGRA